MIRFFKNLLVTCNVNVQIRRKQGQIDLIATRSMVMPEISPRVCIVH